MSEPKIRRKFKSLGITLSTSTAGCTVIRWDDVAGGTLLVGTVSTNATTVQLWGSDSTAGPFGRVYDSSGSAADITLAPSTVNHTRYAIPDAGYGLGSIMLVAGTTNSTAAICRVTLKT